MTNSRVKDFEKEINHSATVPAGSFGKSMIIAPHPDDETLGCGGTAALLLREGIEVYFVFVSDGTMSHPNSEKYPAPRLRALREQEALKAVATLGGTSNQTHFLALPDRNVPDAGHHFFESTVRVFLDLIKSIRPQTIFIPLEDDPHPDHRACFQIVTEAVSRLEDKPSMMQYPIWLWEMGEEKDISSVEKMRTFCVDITQTLAVKHRALLAHQSQISDFIDDDPDGFRLSKQMIDHFGHNREIFFETIKP